MNHFRSRWGLCALSAVIFFVGKSHAEPLGASARQLPARSLKLTGYYRGEQGRDLTFTVGGSGVCNTPAGGVLPTVPFTCDSTGKVPAEGSGQAAVAKIAWQPYDNVQYYLTLGTGKYALHVASLTSVTSLTGDAPGWIYGFGTRANIFPESIASAAIAVDASATWEKYWFNRSAPQPTAALTNVKDRLDLMRLQLAVEASRRFEFDGRWKVEPYGGLKWLRTQAWLKDLNTGTRLGGSDDMVSPFLGVNLPWSDNESLWGEATFVKGFEYATGLAVRF
jgi:hypothetical protein